MIPILGAAVILQTAIASRITLLRGPADLVLLILVSWTLQKQTENAWQWALLAGLILGWISALPLWIPPLAYAAASGLTTLLRNRVWQIPVLALFTAAVLGTLVVHGFSFLALRLGGIPLDWGQAFNLIILPSLLLNLLLAIPVHGLISEVANWTYPEEKIEA